MDPILFGPFCLDIDQRRREGLEKAMACFEQAPRTIPPNIADGLESGGGRDLGTAGMRPVSAAICGRVLRGSAARSTGEAG